MADIDVLAATSPVDGGTASAAVAESKTVLRVLPVIEEMLEIRKRTVERGGFRVTKHVDEVEQIVDEALRCQTVHIERRPIGTLLDGIEPPASRQEGDTLIVPVVEEVLVTERRLMLVEEIRIRRTDAEYREPQRVVLRKEQVSIERLDVPSSD